MTKANPSKGGDAKLQGLRRHKVAMPASYRSRGQRFEDVVRGPSYFGKKVFCMPISIHFHIDKGKSIERWGRKTTGATAVYAVTPASCRYGSQTQIRGISFLPDSVSTHRF
nr:MAG TPA: hypothetical protein [Caudoviricetes sp.]